MKASAGFEPTFLQGVSLACLGSRVIPDAFPGVSGLAMQGARDGHSSFELHEEAYRFSTKPYLLDFAAEDPLQRSLGFNHRPSSHLFLLSFRIGREALGIASN